VNHAQAETHQAGSHHRRCQVCQNAACNPDLISGPVMSFTETVAGTYWFQVTGGTTGQVFTVEAAAVTMLGQ
jgi:hypothetical protein